MTTDGESPNLQSFAAFYQSLSSAKHEHYQTLLDTKVSGPDAFDLQRQHLMNLYKDVHVPHSFVDSSGQIFDCIPIESQPALRKSGGRVETPPTLPTGQRQSARPAARAPVLSADRKDRYGNTMACPPGTVAIRRITLQEMSRFETLEHFLRKSPRRNSRRRSQLLAGPDAPAATDPPHEYAHAFNTVDNIGGHGFLNIWSPSVTGAQIFSLSQQWYVATGPSGTQTAEVGWQVYPQKYGHSKPVLFTYWTADGYQNTGSYSNDAGDFVQYSSTCPVGIALEDISTSGGQQAEVEISFVLSGGNWWLFVNGDDDAHAVGYYPTALYQSGPMATGAAEIDFGGETVGSNSYPAMGSGSFAAQGYKTAAYQRNVTYFPPGGGVQNATLQASQDWPSSYTISIEQSAAWGTFFFFGGPGDGSQVATRAELPPSGASAPDSTQLLGAVLNSVKLALAEKVSERPLLFPNGVLEIDVCVQNEAAPRTSSLTLKVIGAKKSDVS